MWQIIYKKVFLRELKKLPKDVRTEVEEFAFVTLPKTSDPFALPTIKKLTGYREYYRVQFGDYRVGLRIDQHAHLIECCRVKHRKDIYRFFP